MEISSPMCGGGQNTSPFAQVYRMGMELLGIKFAPLNVPLHRRLETLAIAGFIFVMVFGGFAGVLLLYLISLTRFWPLVVIYLIWTYIIDRHTPERGGRRSEWVRSWTWWRYFRDYFPSRLVKVPGVDLDPKKDYLLCCFPHGIFPYGLCANFGSNHCGVRELFPQHDAYLTTLKEAYYLPIYRELILGLGSCSPSSASLNWMFTTRPGGKMVLMIVGGSEEAFYSRPGQYRIILKKRKGFIKIALRHGTPLVPVFSFGETDYYNQLENPEGSLLRRFQDWVKALTRVAPVVPLGRGFFQYSFGLLPFRKPITSVVGRPIEIPKVENPTQEQIDEIHKEFTSKLVELFEAEKHKYVADPENTQLIVL